MGIRSLPPYMFDSVYVDGFQIPEELQHFGIKFDK